jgi:hypothetical protein
MSKKGWTPMEKEIYQRRETDGAKVGSFWGLAPFWGFQGSAQSLLNSTGLDCCLLHGDVWQHLMNEVWPHRSSRKWRQLESCGACLHLLERRHKSKVRQR